MEATSALCFLHPDKMLQYDSVSQNILRVVLGSGSLISRAGYSTIRDSE